MDRYGGLDSLEFTSISKADLMEYITSFVSGQDKLKQISKQIGIPVDVRLMRGDGNGYLFLLIDGQGRFINIRTYGS